MTVRNTAGTSPDRTALPDAIRAGKAPPRHRRRPPAAPAPIRIGDYELGVDAEGRLVATHGATGGTHVLADPNPSGA